MINDGKVLAHVVLVRDVVVFKGEDKVDNLLNSGLHVSFLTSVLISFVILNVITLRTNVSNLTLSYLTV